MAEQVRIDKWLWAVRLYKTRSAANEACSSGRVRVNDSPAKPALRLRVGDSVVARKRGFSSTYRVEKIIEKRVGAAVAVECYTDLTPPEDRPKHDHETSESTPHGLNERRDPDARPNVIDARWTSS